MRMEHKRSNSANLVEKKEYPLIKDLLCDLYNLSLYFGTLLTLSL